MLAISVSDFLIAPIWPVIGLIVGLISATAVALIQKKPTQLQIGSEAFKQLNDLSSLYRQDIQAYREERAELARERQLSREVEAQLRAELGEAKAEIKTLRIELEAAREEIRSLRLATAAQQRLISDENAAIRQRHPDWGIGK